MEKSLKSKLEVYFIHTVGCCCVFFFLLKTTVAIVFKNSQQKNIEGPIFTHSRASLLYTSMSTIRVIRYNKKTEFTRNSWSQRSFLEPFDDTHFPMRFKDSTEKCSNVRLHQDTKSQQSCNHIQTGMFKCRVMRWHPFKYSQQKLGIFTYILQSVAVTTSHWSHQIA